MKDDCMKNTEHSFLQINEKSHVIELQNIKPIISCFCRQHPILSEAVVEKRDSDSKFPKRFAQLGSPRSGSTPAYQIMDELFPGHVQKSHDFRDICPFLYDIRKIVVTVRHPYDIAASMLRMNNGNVDRMFEKFTVANQSIYAAVGSTIFLGSCGDYLELPKCHMFFLKYEDFYGKDVDKVFAISNFLEVNLTNDDANSISKMFSIKENKKREPDGFIHEEHIGDKNGAPMMKYQDSISQDIKNRLYREFGWHFDTFEYEG